MMEAPQCAIGAAFPGLLAGRLRLVLVDAVAGDAWLRDNRLRAFAITRERRWAAGRTCRP